MVSVTGPGLWVAYVVVTRSPQSLGPGGGDFYNSIEPSSAKGMYLGMTTRRDARRAAR